MDGSSETPRGDRRRKILLDVDGVIADFCGAALAVIQDLGHGEFLADDVVEFAMEVLVPEDGRDAFLSRLQAEGFCAALGPYDGADQFVRELRALGDVVVVTAPMPGSSSWQAERDAWLQRHFGLTYVVHTHEKHTVKGDYLIEDKWENAVGWANAHPLGSVLLIDRPYNRRHRGHDRVVRVGDYAEMLWLLQHDGVIADMVSVQAR